MRSGPVIAVVLAVAVESAFGCAPAPSSSPEGASAFGSLTPVSLRGYTGEAMEPFVSRDGRFLFYNTRNDGPDPQLRFAERRDDLNFDDRGEVVGAGSPVLDATPSMDAARTLYFVSTRSYSQDLVTVYRGQFDGTRVSAVTEVNGLSRNELGWLIFDVEVSSDGDTLWVAEGHFSGGSAPDSADLVLATRQGAGFIRSVDGPRMLAAVNTSALEYAPAIRPDGLELFFTRADVAGGKTPSLWRALRPTTDAAFGVPEEIIAASGFVEGPTLSPDGHLLYFHRQDAGRYGIWCVRR
jgi:hypothetical protein